MPGIGDLINRFAGRGLMLPKSQSELLRSLEDFIVVVDQDDVVVACGGLRMYAPDLFEIVGLAVDEAWQGRGLGSAMIGQLVDEATKRGAARVFAMTLSPGLFGRSGFGVIHRAQLAEKERLDCRRCPRRGGCAEIAVQKVLHRANVADPGVAVWSRAARHAPAGSIHPEGAGVGTAWAQPSPVEQEG